MHNQYTSVLHIHSHLWCTAAAHFCMPPLVNMLLTHVYFTVYSLRQVSAVEGHGSCKFVPFLVNLGLHNMKKQGSVSVFLLSL